MPSRGPFVPIGHPRMSQPGDVQDHRVGLHLLEALDSLDAVYGSAAFIAGIAAEEALGDYTLDRCLDAIQRPCGAIFLTEEGELRLHAERHGASQLLRPDLATSGLLPARAAFYTPEQAAPLLRADAPPHNVMVCPIHVGTTRLGAVVVLSPPDALFATGEVKLVTAVTSQAAIAINRSWHHRQVEIERRKLEQVIDHHSDGIVVLEKDGSPTLCNRIARRILGTDDVLGLLGGIDPGLTLDALIRSSAEREVTVATGGQTRVVGITCRAVHAKSGEVANVILTLRDLSRHRREERLKRDFLSLISHKFRTPLTALICGLEIMQTAEADDRDMFLREVGQRTRDLRVLVDRLLYFAELLEGSWSTTGTTDLRELADDLQRQFPAPQGQAAPQIVWDLAADATEVPVPPSRLRVALLNLVDNALKFGSPDTPWVRISTRRSAAGQVTIAVEDRGPGIPADARQQLFGMFHQLDEDFTGAVDGTGIGLAMVREITTRLGGTLALHDALPHGCIFELSFPGRTEA